MLVSSARPADTVEAEIRRAWNTGDVNTAISVTLKSYGPEIYELLVGLHRDPDDASDVFSAFSERLWRSYEHFAWKCSLRTWCYLLARRASLDFRRRGRDARVPLSQAAVSQLVAEVRTETQAHLRTAIRAQLAEIRNALPEPDRVLLILRVDRAVPWGELARVFLASDDPTPENLKREAARLRKRFQWIKARIREKAQARGLLGPSD